MSQRAKPADLPEEVDRAVQVLGNRVRVASILALLEVGRATATELAERIGVGRELVRHHLVELERLGIVDAEPPRADVRRRHFRLNRAALREVLRALRVLDPN